MPYSKNDATEFTPLTISGDDDPPVAIINFSDAAEEDVASCLTGGASGGIDVDRIDDGVAMADDPRLEKAFALIREVIADAHSRGQNDGIANLIRAAGGSIKGRNSLTISEVQPQRAPRGSAGALIRRVLSEVGDQGATTFNIKDAAVTEFERMVTMSAIRNELKIGERDRRYRQTGGVWYLAGRGPTVKAVG